MPRTQAAQDGSPGLQVQGNGTGGANDNVTPDANFMPPLARRSSFEPMRLGALPPPVFSKNAPVGQRSVPAVEYLKQEAAAAVSAAAPAIGTTTPGAADGTVTPGAGLGNGLMSKEPWNLWTDSSAPTAAGADLPTSKASDINPTVSLTQDNADEDLALALAAVVVLNGEDGADGKSKSSKRSSLIAPARTAAWPEEFASTAGSASATFALDPAASPQGSLKTNSGSANLSVSSCPTLYVPDTRLGTKSRVYPPPGRPPSNRPTAPSCRAMCHSHPCLICLGRMTACRHRLRQRLEVVAAISAAPIRSTGLCRVPLDPACPVLAVEPRPQLLLYGPSRAFQQSLLSLAMCPPSLLSLSVARAASLHRKPATTPAQLLATRMDTASTTLLPAGSRMVSAMVRVDSTSATRTAAPRAARVGCGRASRAPSPTRRSLPCRSEACMARRATLSRLAWASATSSVGTEQVDHRGAILATGSASTTARRRLGPVQMIDRVDEAG